MYFWKKYSISFHSRKKGTLGIKPALFILESNLVYCLRFTVYSFLLTLSFGNPINHKPSLNGKL